MAHLLYVLNPPVTRPPRLSMCFCGCGDVLSRAVRPRYVATRNCIQTSLCEVTVPIKGAAVFFWLCLFVAAAVSLARPAGAMTGHPVSAAHRLLFLHHFAGYRP